MPLCINKCIIYLLWVHSLSTQTLHSQWGGEYYAEWPGHAYSNEMEIYAKAAELKVRVYCVRRMKSKVKRK